MISLDSSEIRTWMMMAGSDRDQGLRGGILETISRQPLEPRSSEGCILPGDVRTDPRARSGWNLVPRDRRRHADPTEMRAEQASLGSAKSSYRNTNDAPL